MKTIPLDQAQQNLYKSFELAPLPKMSVEVGTRNTIRILNRLEYIENLTRPRSLSWLGYKVDIVAMDRDTALFIRDDPVCSAVRRLAHHGQAHQYGDVMLSGKHAPEPMIGAASAIALVQQTESGDIQILRKKEVGLENKHAAELIKEFHNIQPNDKSHDPTPTVDKSGDDVVPWESNDLIVEDSDVAMMKFVTEESKPPLKKEVMPPLKKNIEVPKNGDYAVPW